jgi:hypothetical protein
MLADVRNLISSNTVPEPAEGPCFDKLSNRPSFDELRERMDEMSDQELAEWYNDHVIYPDKVRLNCYYYRHYSFAKDIQMIVCTVLGKKMAYAGEVI